MTVPSLSHDFTDPIEPTLAIEITPDEIVISSEYMHETWRAHLRREFEERRASSNWFSARQDYARLLEALDEEAPFIRKSRVQVVKLQDGRVGADNLKGSEASLDVQPLFDELFEPLDSMRNAAKLMVGTCRTDPLEQATIVARIRVDARTWAVSLGGSSMPRTEIKEQAHKLVATPFAISRTSTTMCRWMLLDRRMR